MRFSADSATVLSLTVLLFVGAFDEREEPVKMSLAFESADAETAAALERHAVAGRERIDEFFELPFLAPFSFQVLPDRSAFDAFFEEKWGIEETQCWWVAAGLEEGLIMLSPRVWKTDACEHDGQDSAHVKGIVMHELVHVFHAQYNPGIEELEEIGWFIEGLATLVSGQLDDEGRMKKLKAGLEEGPVIESLKDGWSGPDRYAIAGTLVEYIDVTYGRDTTRKLLALRREAEILAELELTEGELLEKWRAHAKKRPRR